MVNAPASAPVRLNVTAPPCTSVAVAVYTTAAVLVPSGTETLVAEVIVGATSVTLIVTACVLKAPLGSEALTLKEYELFVSKSGLVLKVTAPVALLIVKAPASAPVRL